MIKNYLNFLPTLFVIFSALIITSCSSKDEDEEFGFPIEITEWEISPKVEFDTLNEKSWYWYSYNYTIPNTAGEYVLTSTKQIWDFLHLTLEGNHPISVSDTLSYQRAGREDCFKTDPVKGEFFSVEINDANPEYSFKVKVDENPTFDERTIKIAVTVFLNSGYFMIRLNQLGK